jgi:hypothetical protein
MGMRLESPDFSCSFVVQYVLRHAVLSLGWQRLGSLFGAVHRCKTCGGNPFNRRKTRCRDKVMMYEVSTGRKVYVCETRGGRKISACGAAAGRNVWHGEQWLPSPVAACCLRRTSASAMHLPAAEGVFPQGRFLWPSSQTCHRLQEAPRLSFPCTFY